MSEIFQNGWNAYVNNEGKAANPYPSGWEEHLAWLRGWLNAQAVNA